MRFVVIYKGMRHFTGSLTAAMEYLETNWNSVTDAYEIGVKLVPVHPR